jgi:hypothetical protein
MRNMGASQGEGFALQTCTVPIWAALRPDLTRSPDRAMRAGHEEEDQKVCSRQKALGPKSQESAGQESRQKSDVEKEVSDQEVSDQEVSDQEVSDQEVSDQEVSDEEVCDEEVSDQEVSEQEVDATQSRNEDAKRRHQHHA